MTDTQPTAPMTENKMPSWMVFIGVIVAAVGLVVTIYAGVKRKGAQSGDEFRQVLGLSHDTAAGYVTMGHWGVGILVVGVALTLAGVTVMAVNRGRSGVA